MAKSKTLITADGQKKRWCPCCKSWQLDSDFYNNAARPNGKSTACKVCDRLRWKPAKKQPQQPTIDADLFARAMGLPR